METVYKTFKLTIPFNQKNIFANCLKKVINECLGKILKSVKLNC